MEILSLAVVNGADFICLWTPSKCNDVIDAGQPSEKLEHTEETSDFVL